jgi:hypothetical protein
MTAVSRKHNESGMALVTVLLVMVLVSGLAVGMFAAVTMEQRSHAIDRDQTQVYAAAHAGLEKLTADLGALFLRDFSPDKNQLNALTASTRVPSIAGFEYTAPGGSAGSGYGISWTGSPNNDPVPLADTMITAGPYSGFKGLLTRYDITITARSQGGSEVRLRRGLQTVAVPVFQFGVFSDTDLTFFGGDNFDFGGRVHTNGNLWLSEASGSTLLFTDKITVYGDVNRRYLSNGLEASTNGMSGNVNILTAIGNTASARTMKYSPNESSVTNNVGGYWTSDNAAAVTACNALTPPKVAPCWMANGAVTNNGGSGLTAWTTVSQTNYAGNLTNRLTGATVLRLPLVSQGATPIDLIRRPPASESSASVVFGQRYFSMASLRIMLSDRASDITSLATVTGTAPVLLDGDWKTTAPTGYGPVDATHPPIARSIGVATNTLTSGSSYSGGLTQISINGTVDPNFLAPGTSGGPSGTSMWIQSTLGTATVTACTARTATTFTGCTVGSPGAALSGTLYATLPSGLTVSAPLTNVAITATTGRTLTLVSSGTMTTSGSTNPVPTARFVPGLMWVVPSSSTTQGKPITCEGYNLVSSPKQFTNCRGLAAVSEAASGYTISSQATSALNKGLIGGYIKIEKQTTAGAWSDVTMEILNLGIGDANQEGYACGDPTPNAVLRIQRLRDNGNSTGSANNLAGGCPYTSSQNGHDWWPQALYDTREGTYRPGSGFVSGMTVGGMMGYIALDVNNLRRWLAGSIGSTGTQAANVNGYIVYFSDRRGDHNENNSDVETGQYGFENVVNPSSATGDPSASTTLDIGEDFNANGTLDRWGETPHLLGIQQTDWTGYNAPFNASTRPWTGINVNNAGQARMNRQVLFRRALKLINAGICATGNANCTVGATRMPANGLTVASENPVYVQGNYNASSDPVTTPTETHQPASVIADAVTILSNNWKDSESFENPNSSTNRSATTTGYRFAVVTGKSLSFPYPTAGSPQFLFGTDGGAGNFLRMMENWRLSGVDLNYRGSMVSLFTAQQATGTFKYHSTPVVYDYADRNFKFDEEFLQPALLPPGTPMFRDVNLLSFRQILRPNQ